MGAPVEETARAALAAIDTDAGLLRCVKFVSERYRELTQRAKFRHLRRVGELNIVAPVTAGLATVTRDSDLVTGDATSSPLWTSDLIGRHFRAQVTWYEITDVVPHATAAQLRLRSKYSEAPASTQPVGYRVVQRWVRLDPMARHFGDFVLMRRRRRLQALSLKELDMSYPARNNITNGPRIVSEIGTDTDGRKLVEFYPYSDLSEHIRYAYWPIARDLQIGDTLPDELDLVLLKKGVLVDLFRYEMAKAARLNSIEKAALYRNEMRAQVTEWEVGILDAIRADKGMDDVTFILRTGAGMQSDDPLIKDAHDEVYSRWPL